jgi:hypothetical protein
MSNKVLRRVGIGIAVVIAVTALSLPLALHFATRALKNQIQQALGTTSDVGEIVVGWSTIELHKVDIRAPANWPAEETLRADNVIITPDLKALIASKQLVISRIEVDAPYLSILRSRDGKVHLLPSLLEDRKPADDAANKATSNKEKTGGGIEVAIGKLEIHNGMVDFFDASITKSPHKITLEKLDASVADMHVPTIAGKTDINVSGEIKGVHQDGKLTIDGWLDLVGKNSEIATQLRGVDLIALQPYLIKAAETGVRKGTLDLDLKSTVRDNHLNAPGKVTLTGLELESTGGAMNTFMGIPRKAVLASLENRNDQIVVPFTLSGNLDDPHFSLNESLLTHVGSGIAGALGISIEGLAHGVGNAAQGVEGVVKKLFGK